MPDQPLELLPAERPTVSYDAADLVDLTALDFDHEPGEPSPQFIANVRQLGVLQPVLVDKRHGRLVVIDGVRRCKAARAVGLAMIHTIEKPAAIASDVATLVANNQRSPNPQTELAAIDRLIARTGAAPKEISRQLGIPYATVKRRLKLRKLAKGARQLFDRGEISVGVAEKLSRLPKGEQRAVVARAKDGDGRVTATLVNEARQVQTTQAIAQLDGSLFEGPTAEDVANMRAVPVDAIYKLVALCRSVVKADDAARTLEDIAAKLEEIIHHG